MNRPVRAGAGYINMNIAADCSRVRATLVCIGVRGFTKSTKPFANIYSQRRVVRVAFGLHQGSLPSFGTERKFLHDWKSYVLDAYEDQKRLEVRLLRIERSGWPS
jgi:hypothetical protein